MLVHQLIGSIRRNQKKPFQAHLERSLLFESLESRSLLSSTSTIVFSDENLSIGNYSKIVLQEGNGGSVSEAFQASGGNPGSYLEVTTSPAGRPGGIGTLSRVMGVYLNQSSVYSPKEKGAILELDYSEDYRFISSQVIPTPHNGQAIRPALMQDGQIFLGPQTFFSNTTAPTSWRQVSWQDLDSASFSLWNSVDVHPNFSETGEAITFGFCRLNTATGVNSYSIIAGVDNWRVELATSGFKIDHLNTKTFVATDTITVAASIGSETAGVQVLWTVEGRGAAANITVLPKDVATTTDANGRATFSFTPADIASLVANRRTEWTRGSEQPNTAIGFEIVAKYIADGQERVTRLSDTQLGPLQQDEIDVLRQEYFDYDIPVPARSEVVPSLGAGFNRGNYSYQLSDGMRTRYDAILAAYRGAPVSVVVDGQTYQTNIPANAALTISSGYRNPQRNKFVGSNFPDSRHTRGQALDLVPSAVQVLITVNGRARRVVLPLHGVLYPALLGAAQTQGTAIAEDGATNGT